ncbi:MAG: Hint domain-containing protein [Octadecabacter sp.]|nr:Hint domain-containing protein [Octadecabacter sp.]
MMKTPRNTAGLAVLPDRFPVHSSDRFAQPDRRPQRAQFLMRRYEVAYLRDNGDIHEFTRLAPAIAAFEDSFASLARSALLPTDRGTVAIEDILPGDKVKTVTNGFQTVHWCGAITLVPNHTDQDARRYSGMNKLTRISADALGIGRPMMDLLLGPSARLYHRSPTLERVTSHAAAFVPASDFIDGVNIIEISPPTPVKVFQIGFANHERITVNGVELDSHNPGARHELNLRGDMLALYMSLFPHVTRIEDFGRLAHPRLSLHDLDFGDVA